jgi:hypothetical protein
MFWLLDFKIGEKWRFRSNWTSRTKTNTRLSIIYKREIKLRGLNQVNEFQLRKHLNLYFKTNRISFQRLKISQNAQPSCLSFSSFTRNPGQRWNGLCFPSPRVARPDPSPHSFLSETCVFLKGLAVMHKIGRPQEKPRLQFTWIALGYQSPSWTRHTLPQCANLTMTNQLVPGSVARHSPLPQIPWFTVDQTRSQK